MRLSANRRHRPEELGKAGNVEEKRISGEEMIFVTECENPKAVSVIIRGGTEHVVAGFDRAIEDALRVVSVPFLRTRSSSPAVVHPEIGLSSLRLRDTLQPSERALFRH